VVSTNGGAVQVQEGANNIATSGTGGGGSSGLAPLHVPTFG
jgi:hypothetical protein